MKLLSEHYKLLSTIIKKKMYVFIESKTKLNEKLMNKNNDEKKHRKLHQFVE